MESIKLNLVPSDFSKPVCHASQYDDGREIMLELYDDKIPYILSDEEIELDVKKLDGNIVTTDLTVEAGKNYVIMVTTEQMCAIAGRNNCELKVQKDGKTIYSKNFYLAVEESATAGGIQSASEINNLETQIAGMVEDAVENQYDSENVIFDSEPTEGHGTGYTVTSAGIKAAIDAAGGGGVSPDVITDEYDATSTYAVGDMVIHENALYVCSTAITTAEAWNSSHWTLTDIATAIGTVKTAIPTKTSDLQNDSGFAQIDDTTESASKTYSSEKIESLVYPEMTVSGESVNFYTSLVKPLVSIKADVTGTETGTGTASPSNPHIVTKFNEVEIKHYADDIAEADTVTIALGDTYYRGKLTITDKGNGYAGVHFTGTHRAITIDDTSLSNTGWFASFNQLAINNILSSYPAKYTAYISRYASDKLKAIDSDGRPQNVGNYITCIASGMSVAVSIPECDTEAKAKAFFNNNSVVFAYELATPIEIDLPDISSIVAFSGENNLFADSGKIEVVYKATTTDINNTLENQMSELDTDLMSYVDDKTKYELEISTIKLASTQTPTASVKHLSFVCGKWINKQGIIPDYEGYLFVDEATQKYYYTTDLALEPQFLFDWDSSLVNGDSCKLYSPTITADGDIIFLKNFTRHNPIVYPNGDYSNPYEVDFGANKKPYAWLVSSSVVHFDDGSFCYGDYAYHSLEDEQNDDRRIIWKVSKPYNNPANWVQAHSFKHVYFTSSQSNEPDNEIGHIHAIMYDFYADDLYCTTGDIDRHCRMWISTDHGDTWSAVPNAVGTTANVTTSGQGQKWRMTNGVFTKEGIWWGTDSERPYHKLWKCTRALSGHIDFDTLTEVADLEIPVLPNNYSQRTYITALVRNPDGLLLIDRGEPRPDKLDIRFYDFASGKVEIVGTFERATTDASSLDQNDRIGLCMQCTTVYQPQSLLGVLTGGGLLIRPNNTSVFNNSKSNYVGTLFMRLK